MASRLSHQQAHGHTAARNDRPIARLARAAPWPASVIAAVVVSCCVTVPPALLVAAHLTLSAAAGVGVGVLAAVAACMLRSPDS
jgi:hypothetical protein